MYCRTCRKWINIKKTFRNLLVVDDRQVCSNCFKLHMNYFPYFVVPIHKGLLHIFELLYKTPQYPGDFVDYFRPYYKAYIKAQMTIDAIYIETLTMKTIELFDQMELGNLIIFTNNFKEE